MCGLAGYLVSPNHPVNQHPDTVLTAMGDTIRHRGPDDSGTWSIHSRGVGLAHRRLAIVDLSPGGHQPMRNSAGNHVIAFNGEIYNHLALRAELESGGTHFRSNSDTEVLIEAVAKWGIQAACRRLVGMFAFAVWDEAEDCIWLARDRIGKKPLYFWSAGNGFVFASELKALRAFPGFQPEVDGAALAEYLRYGYVSEHCSIFCGVAKVLPGELVRLSLSKGVTRAPYWSLRETVAHAVNNRILDPKEAEESLLGVLREATRSRMVADVPLGAFLSGGIDSGLVVSLMQEAASHKVRTFSIGFHEAAFNEAHVARAVAGHLGTDHTELYVSDRQALDVVPKLAEMFDEPFADSSQIPTYLLAALTRQQVTVALTGDGGDESFGGYARYRNEYGLLGQMYRLPHPLRALISRSALAVPAGAWEMLSRTIPANRRPRFLGSKVAKYARALRQDSAAERGKTFLSFWSPDLMRIAPPELGDPFSPPAGLLDESSEAMQFWESLHYLPGDLLAKVDRATMAVSLEARSPLLDQRVIELAWRLPASMKASQAAPKRILRELLYRYVPREMIDLPKQGFSVPVGPWLRSSLRDWAADTLNYGRGAIGDWIDWSQVDAAWAVHQRGGVGQSEKLWTILMLCEWHKRWLGSPVSAPCAAFNP
jgi:asparagine synthase (glutamine-hydrolysing)